MTSTPQAAGPPRIDVRASGDFLQWLDRANGTLLVTTYTSGKLAAFSMIDGALQTRIGKFARPLGMALNGNRLAIAARGEILLYAPRVADPPPATTVDWYLQHRYQTGKVDAHDVAFGRRGLYFVNTRFNCLARPSTRVNFLRAWNPPFVSDLVAKDCCHLNGLAMRRGSPALATAFCRGSEPKSWRAGDRFTSGILIDIPTNEVVAEGLCMPHSPRRFDGKWWFCDSGRGFLSRWIPGSSTPHTIAELPGFTRGLGFACGRALVGLSKIREKHILDAPPIRERCREQVAGVALVDLAAGTTTGVLEFVRGGNEVYETLFVPHARDIRVETSP